MVTGMGVGRVEGQGGAWLAEKRWMFEYRAHLRRHHGLAVPRPAHRRVVRAHDEASRRLLIPRLGEDLIEKRKTGVVLVCFQFG